MPGVSGASPLRTLLLGSQATDGTITGVTSGTSQGLAVEAYANVTIYVTASAALSAGTLIVEEADYDTDREMISNNWSVVATYTLSSVFSGAGGKAANHLPAASYNHVRVRIGTTVVGGTVYVRMGAN